MTRDSIPRDDLYGELEVSRQASVAAIEAAYRRLVKQHHPDVARSDDLERIKRLNLAREWLTDLDRRRRYDVSRGMSPTSAVAHHSANGDGAASGTRRRPGPASAVPAPDASSEPARSFGVNANDVRIFLASLRGLDSERARRVFDGRAVAHAKGYTVARRAAGQIGQSKRKTEWQLAREAASVIARGKLGDTTLTEQVVDVLADIAGAIVIRDLLSKSDYTTLLLPWTWTSARLEPVPAPEPRPAAPPLADAAPEGVPAARWAEAFGAKWPPPRGPIAPAVTAGPLVGQAAGATPVAAAPVVTASVVDAAVPVSGQPPVEVAATEPAAAPTAPPPAERPAPRVAISDLGVSPWQPGSQGKAEPPRSAAVGPQALARASRPNLAAPSVALPNVALPALIPSRVRVPGLLPAAIGIMVFVVVAGALIGIGRPPSEQSVAGITAAPTGETSDGPAGVVTPDASIAGPAAEPRASDPGGETPVPGATEPPGGPGGPGGPGLGPTQAPGSTPRPTPEPPTPPPAPSPTPPTPPTSPPAPTPPPTPEPQCTVPDLIGATKLEAILDWATAGFTGSITDDPPMQPNQRIGFQSLPAGASEPCSSGITVHKVT